jgi:hypothetical protein
MTTSGVVKVLAGLPGGRWKNNLVLGVDGVFDRR